jgi:hypothetical protein
MRFTVFVVLCVCFGTISRAEVVLSNLSQASAGFGLGVGTNNPADGANLMRAETFRTGMNLLGYRINSVTLSMGGSTGSGLGDLQVQLFSTAPFQPASSIGDFIVSSNPATAGLYTYAFSNPNLVLARETHYSIVVRSPNSAGPTVSQYGWRIASSLDPISDPSWLLFDNLVKTEGASTWSSVRAAPYQFAIDATSVPEPTAIGLLAIGALVLGALRERCGSRVADAKNAAAGISVCAAVF